MTIHLQIGQITVYVSKIFTFLCKHTAPETKCISVHTQRHTHTIIHTLLYTESKKTKLARQEKIRTYSASVDNSPKLKTIVQSWKQLSNMTKKPNINTKQKTLTHTIQTDTEL